MNDRQTNPSHPPVALLSPADLIELAGPAAYDRGFRYFQDGHVTALRFDDRRVSGTVEGTFPYDVMISDEDGALAWACSCPAAEDGSFCKHLVALCLALGAAGGAVGASATDSDPTGSPPIGAVDIDALRAHLAAKAPEELVALLVEVTREAPQLEDRFRLEMARTSDEGPDLGTYRRVIDETTAIHDFVYYRGAFDFARRVEEAVAAISDLLDEGYADAAIELAEHALGRLELAWERIDDSAGLLQPITEELEALHLRACERERPDPESLARRLFERELTSDWDVFDQAILRYGHVLGTRGREEYRRLASERWATVRPLGPGERDPEEYGSRFRITRIMEALAEADGDVDAKVDVLARDLSSPYRYLRIAEILADSGAQDRALEWAERGLVESTRPDHRLTDFVALAYQRRGRGEEAVSLMWEEFARSPRLDRYVALRRHAEPSDAWSTWRERAVSLLRVRPDRSELVRILLSEGETDAAWEEAREGDCTEDLWLRLAEMRAETHPDDAIPIYRRAVERAIDRKDKRGYREAVELMRIVADLMRAAHQPEAFEPYVEEVRATHRRKRNLMKLLEGLEASGSSRAR